MADLLAVAERIFLRHGYYDTTMNDIALAAGMSKKTIYTLVDSKAGLFAAVLAHQHAQIIYPTAQPDWSLADTLTANLTCLAHFLLSPPQIALTRLIMAEHTNTPDFGRIFLHSRVLKAKARLHDCLASVARDYGATPHQAKELSAMLFGMALGEFHAGMLIGFRAAPSKAALAARIRLAVDIFLAGCHAAKPSKPLSPLSATCSAPPPGA